MTVKLLSADLNIAAPTMQVVDPASGATAATPVTIQGDGQFHTFLIEGFKAGDASVVAYQDSTLLARLFHVDVRGPLTRNVKLFSVVQSDGTLRPSTQIDSNALQTELNRINFKKQANVTFNVTGPISDLTVDYDFKPADGKLNDPSEDPGTDSEWFRIANALQGLNPGVNDQFGLYVKAFNSRLHPTARGLTFSQSPYTFVADPLQNAVHENTVYNVTAHEFGHGLGVNHNVVDPKRRHELMYETEQGDNPCRIRETEWNQMNPPPRNPN